MQTFYLTVGARYASEKHPFGLHPSGWVEISAASYSDAREFAFKTFGQQWAGLYDAATFDRSYHPNGCTMRFGALPNQGGD